MLTHSLRLPFLSSIANHTDTSFRDNDTRERPVSGDKLMLLENSRKPTKTGSRGKRYNKEERGQLCPELVRVPPEVKERRKKPGKRKEEREKRAQKESMNKRKGREQ